MRNSVPGDVPREVLRVLAPMREGPLSLSGRPQEERALRERVVSALQAQLASQVPQVVLAQRARAARLRRGLVLGGVGAALAAAAATLAWMGGPSAESGATLHAGRSASKVAAGDMSSAQALELSVLPDVRDAAAAQGAEPAAWIDASGVAHALAAGEGLARLPQAARELRSHGRRPRLRTGQGAEVSLAPQSRLALRSERAGEEPQLRLLAGEVACTVPKLGPSRQFAIDAPGARVIVHGTRFTVRAQGERTCVRVSEGLVAVHPEQVDAQVTRLGPGQSWGCEPQRAAGSEAARQSRAKRAASRAQPRAQADKAEVALAEQETSRGTLDAENQLLAKALRAERAGDVEAARALLQTLLRRYPGSPLAVEARAALQRAGD